VACARRSSPNSVWACNVYRGHRAVKETPLPERAARRQDASGHCVLGSSKSTGELARFSLPPGRPRGKPTESRYPAGRASRFDRV
jgi:hypothetical protein